MGMWRLQLLEEGVEGGNRVFCPKCGAENRDNAEFCNKCGAKIGNRATASKTPQKKAVPARSIPIAPIAAAAVVLLAVIGLFVVLRGCTKPDANVSSIEATMESRQTDDSSDYMVEDAPDRISPREDIQVSNVKLDLDEVNRYVLTGSIKNNGEFSYTVDVRFCGTKHSSDAYGEETTKSEVIRFGTITP